jgi:hypothetical protein
MTTRRGASLIELLVIMSACTVVLTLTGVLITRVMRVQIQSRGFVAAERAAQRLSDQFRNDVHCARNAVADTAGRNKHVFLRLDLADGQKIEYARTGDNIARVEYASGQPEWREEFICPAASELSVEQHPEPPRMVFNIFMKLSNVAPTPDKPFIGTGPAPVTVHAEAVIGRDIKFSAAKPTEEAKK